MDIVNVYGPGWSHRIVDGVVQGTDTVHDADVLDILKEYQ